MQIIVRRAEVKDVKDLSDLFREFNTTDSNMENMQKVIEIISDIPQYYVAVACEGDKVVGTAMGILCYELVGECNPFMIVENVVVATEHQGLGIGRILMNAIEEFGRLNRCNYIILISESKREGSHKFYETIGYSTDQRGFKKSLLHRD
jgi:GNAT superfamily N-acetyltransferase